MMNEILQHFQAIDNYRITADVAGRTVLCGT
jgi:hypothetical protein